MSVKYLLQFSQIQGGVFRFVKAVGAGADFGLVTR